MNSMAPKKLAIIQDLAGMGRCSLSVALPIVSACRVQAIPLPTAIFSNHTGYSDFYKHDFTDYMKDYLDCWDKLSFTFDGIYCGYVGNTTQMQIITSYIRTAKTQNENTCFFLDPVMGDHGTIYKGLSDDYLSFMKDFVALADFITPNITEACLLTDTEYKEDNWSKAELITLSNKLHQLGPKYVIITGIHETDAFHNFISQASSMTQNNGSEYSPLSSHTESVYAPVSGASRPGTGDIFASIVFSLTLRDIPLSKAVKIASDFIACCINGSDEANVPIQEGVIFENYLARLCDIG